MAIYYARKSGNVNAADVWATTPSGTASDVFSTFTNQDTLVSNNFTITLNVNTTVLEVRNDTTGGATSGGTFTLSNGVTLRADVNGSNSSATLITINNSSNTTPVYIIGNITGSTTNSLTVGTVMTSYTAAPYVLYITGNITTPIGASGPAVYWVIAGATLNINGNIIGYGSSNTVRIDNGLCNITGNVIGGPNTSGINLYNCTAATVLNVTGSVTGGGNNANFGGIAVYQGSPTINITGACIGGPYGGAGISFAGTGSTAIITATRAKGNGFGNGSVGLNSAVGIAAIQTTTVKVYEIEYGDLGQSPTSGPIEMINATSNVSVFAVRLSTKKTLVDLNNSTNLIPASGNVRSGISYNYGNNTGSCVIPNSNSVVYGVPVDNVTGSGLLSPVAIWNALTSSIGTSGSIGERLKNCSTVATAGKQLEGVL